MAIACPRLLTPSATAGDVAPAPCTTKPMRGSVDLSPWLTDWPVVNQRSSAVTVESPVDVAATYVWLAEPSSPWSVMPTCTGVGPVLVTMLSQRTQSSFSGTNTWRVSVRFRSEKTCGWKFSCRFLPL